MYRNKAFTLIELLVVIAIIAILAAILFPVFAQARESARTISCLNNEKQITLGILQYVQDYDEKFPIYQYGVPDSIPDKPFGGAFIKQQFGWNDGVYPYVKNTAIFYCPDVNSPGNDFNNPAKHTSEWTGVMNYATNCYLTARTSGTSSKMAQIQFPASVIILSEAGAQTSAGACEGQDGVEWGWMGDAKTNTVQEGATNDKNHPPLARHKGGANYAFSDGHAKWYNAHTMGLVTDGVIPSDTQFDTVSNSTGNHPTWLVP